MKGKVTELETNIKNFCRVSMTLSRVSKLELTYRRMRRVIWLQTPTACCLGGGIISLSY